MPARIGVQRGRRAARVAGARLKVYGAAQLVGKISMIRKLLIAIGLFFSTAAQAEWREATSANFVVYTEGSEQEARDFAAKLEKFNYVLRRYHNVREPAQVPRFRVFLLDSISAVQHMIDSPGVAGYYIPDARALVPTSISPRASGT